MKLSLLTLDRLKTRIIGDEGPFPYLNGTGILKLFNEVGFKDIYDFKNRGMPGSLSRKNYAFEKMKEINGTAQLQKLIEIIASKVHFLSSPQMFEDAISELNTILAEDNFELVDVGKGSYKISGAVAPEQAVVAAHFEENRTKIIEEIRKAKFLIWVAVAWLTDKELLTELRKKKEEGLNIQIVTQDDNINAGLKESVLKVFEAYYKAPKGIYKNLMHHKFCIIDLRTVVHGSYNWTVKAQYNDETVSVTQSADFAADFAETFMKLKNADKQG
jgi:hypothetical protein